MSEQGHWLDEETIKLKCPVCEGRDFRLIYLLGERYTAWVEEKSFIFPSRQPLETYRCLTCDYVLTFARKEP